MKGKAPWRKWQPGSLDGPVTVDLSWTQRSLTFPSLKAVWLWQKGRTPGVKAVSLRLLLPTLDLRYRSNEIMSNGRSVMNVYRRSGRWVCLTTSRSYNQLQELVDALEWLQSQPR